MSDQYPQNPDPSADPTHQIPQYGQQEQPGQQSYAPLRTAVAPLSQQDERTWGAISHAGAVVAMICSAGFLGFVGSAVVYLLYKDRGPFVRAHAANSLNVQISMYIWLVVAAVVYVILGIVTLGIGFVVLLPLFLVPPVVAGILHVVGAVKAYQGEWWNPPLTPRFVQ